MSDQADGFAAPQVFDFRGEGEATETWTGEAWIPTPFAREAAFSIFPSNRRAMEADGWWDAYLAYLTRGTHARAH